MISTDGRPADLQTARVAIVCESPSDWDLLEPAKRVLDRFEIGYEAVTSSAFRNPTATARWAADLDASAIAVVIAASGYAGHLAGLVASHTVAPVIGVPLDSSPLKGIDALLSTVMMPSGVPVATVTIGASGARNAALLAAQILAVGDPRLAQSLRDYRAELSRPR